MLGFRISIPFKAKFYATNIVLPALRILKSVLQQNPLDKRDKFDKDKILREEKSSSQQKRSRRRCYFKLSAVKFYSNAL